MKFWFLGAEYYLSDKRTERHDVAIIHFSYFVSSH